MHKFPSAIPHLAPLYQGKTRDTFATKSPEHLLIVATDRLSTHNVVHKSVVPFKGAVLTSLTVFWMSEALSDARIPHHLEAYGSDIEPYLIGDPSEYPEDLRFRAIVVRKLRIIPVEFIYRARMSGSLYRDFYSKGLPNPYEIELAPGIPLMAKFPAPLFTPTEKSAKDAPMSAQAVLGMHPEASELGHYVFDETRDFLRRRGIEEIDAKLEMGHDSDGTLRVGDEVVTPDTSRFADSAKIREGFEPPWLDKQIVRDEAERIWAGGEKVPLEFSPDILKKTSDTYLSMLQRITSFGLETFQEGFLD